MPKPITTIQSQIKLTTATPEQIVHGFKSMAFSRSLVRLSFANYWSGNREESLEGYRQDRNRIRRQTRLLEKASRELFWRNDESVATALLHACRGERLSFDATRQKWEYITGQYTPTEIRFEAYRVALQAVRFLINNPSV